jgi:6-pyruvoyltetrahydropterin/6-carboxytetrahydropterin synthase
MRFQITTTRHFSAGHQLRLYDGSLEPIHGHNWVVRITVAAEKLDAIGVVMDFHDLERRVEKIVSPMHNRHLNELPVFSSVKPSDAAANSSGPSANPSAENVAAYIGRALALPGHVALVSVEVWETPENSAIYRP